MNASPVRYRQNTLRDTVTVGVSLRPPVDVGVVITSTPGCGSESQKSFQSFLRRLNTDTVVQVVKTLPEGRVDGKEL